MDRKIKYKIKTARYLTIRYERLEDIIKKEYNQTVFITKDQKIDDIIEFNEDKRVIMFVSGDVTVHAKNRVKDFIQSGRYDWILKDLMNYMCSEKLIPKGTYLII